MQLIFLPESLFLFYGAVVLGCGIALGVIAGRHWARPRGPASPAPPDLLLQRVTLLELELEQTGRDLEQLRAEREFMRELRRPRSRVAAA